MGFYHPGKEENTGKEIEVSRNKVCQTSHVAGIIDNSLLVYLQCIYGPVVCVSITFIIIVAKVDFIYEYWFGFTHEIMIWYEVRAASLEIDY